MCEILVKATNATHPDPDTDRRGCYKRGYPVVVMPDGHPWGTEERLPLFVVIKLPGVEVETALKYIEPWQDALDPSRTYCRRVWRIKVDDLPAAAKQKLATTGQLIIKVGTYAGEYDYTWAQVRTFFHNMRDNVTE